MLSIFKSATGKSGKKNSYRWLIATSAVIILTPLAIWALNPSVAPGGNFDLSVWQLQLPIGSPGDPTTIPSSQLEGSNGYQDPGHQYFFTESGDGAMVMKVYGNPSTSGCVTTANSNYCRTELKENNSWEPTAATNRLKATLYVTAASDSSVVIGQIHMDASVSTKPVVELYYHSNGDIYAGVEQTRSGGDEVLTYLANVPEGTTFTYELEYYGGVLKAAINSNFTTLSTYSLDNPLSYFKAGCYDQGDNLADVHFLALTIQH